MPENNFRDLPNLQSHIQEKQTGFILVGYRELEGYAGMATAILIRFDLPSDRLALEIEWVCLGLDPYGDTLMESLEYPFPDLEKLLAFLHQKFGISVNEIPVAYKFDNKQFPNPAKDADRKAEFQESWERFQEDFQAGRIG